MLLLRPATLSDAGRLLAWRNDPVTRAMSFNSEPVQTAEHVAWLARTLANPDVALLIAEADGYPVGTVRLDYSGNGETEVSLTIAPEQRGKGYATEAIRLARARTPYPLVARIKAENEASRRAFTTAGLELVEVVHRG